MKKLSEQYGYEEDGVLKIGDSEAWDDGVDGILIELLTSLGYTETLKALGMQK